MNMERGIIVADNAISLTFSMIDFLDSRFFICSSKVLPCVVVLGILLNKVDTYSVSLAFVGGFKDLNWCKATAGGHWDICYGSASSLSHSVRLLTVKDNDHISPMYSNHNMEPAE